MRLHSLLLLTLVLVITAKTNVIPLEVETREWISFGQENLSAMLELSGGLNGKILLDEQVAGSRHEKQMLTSITSLIPDQNVITSIEAVSYSSLGWPFFDDIDRIPRTLKEHGIRVMHTPDASLSVYRSDILEFRLQILKEIDALEVHAVGNIDSYPHPNVYHQEDPYWGPPVEGDFLHLITAGKEFQEVETYLQGGHTILASYAMQKPKTFRDFINSLNKNLIDDLEDPKLKTMYQNADKYIRHPHIIPFGELKEYGFTVLVTGRFAVRSANTASYPSSSHASSHVAGFALYLFQLWDTTAEVVEVMQKTAIDIGEPGPDEEFGWGLINADHPIIWNRAIERLQQSLSFCLLEDIAFEEAITATSKNKGLDIFHDIRSDKREMGLTYKKGKTTLAFATGSAQGLFGLRSRFLHRQSPFMQIGLQHSLISNVSFVGVFGQSEQEDFTIRKGSLGVHYQRNLSEQGDLSLYAGYRVIRGSIGLPGHTVMDIAQVPFALNMPDIRASLNWSF